MNASAINDLFWCLIEYRLKNKDVFLYSTNFPNTNAGNTWSILEYFTKVCYVIYAAQQSARSINYKTTVHVSVIDTRVFIEGLNFNYSKKHCALSSQPLNPILRLVWYSITNENKFHLRCGLELPFVFVQNIFLHEKNETVFILQNKHLKMFLKKLTHAVTTSLMGNSN